MCSRLPYYGRAYSVPYGGGEGLSFEGPMKGFQAIESDKGSSTVSFEVTTREDTYTYSVNLWPGGSADIQVHPTKKQSISFTGEIKQKRDRE